MFNRYPDGDAQGEFAYNHTQAWERRTSEQRFKVGLSPGELVFNVSMAQSRM